MNLTKEKIIQEILNGSEIGKQILEIEIDYYRSLVKEKQSSPNLNKTNRSEDE